MAGRKQEPASLLAECKARLNVLCDHVAAGGAYAHECAALRDAARLAVIALERAVLECGGAGGRDAPAALVEGSGGRRDRSQLCALCVRCRSALEGADRAVQGARSAAWYQKLLTNHARLLAAAAEPLRAVEAEACGPCEGEAAPGRGLEAAAGERAAAPLHVPPRAAPSSEGSAAVAAVRAAAPTSHDLALRAGGSSPAGCSRQGSSGASSGGQSLALKLPDSNQWILSREDLQLTGLIGQGAFGEVHRGLMVGATEVAVKKLQLPDEGDGGSGAGVDLSDKRVLEGLRALQREVGILATVHHPNVVLFMGVCLDPPWLVTEYCERGSLHDLIGKARVAPGLRAQLDWGRRLCMALDAAKGMAYLHSRSPPIIHRDLKSPNLLVSRNWTVKVGDFGLSRIVDSSVQASSITATNPRWLAPEALRDQAFQAASDVYSFGVVMAELATLEEPFANMRQFQIVLAVADRNERPHVPPPGQLPGADSFPAIDDYLALMRDCWAPEPSARPSFLDVIARLKPMLTGYLRAQRVAPTGPTPTSSPGATSATSPPAAEIMGPACSALGSLHQSFAASSGELEDVHTTGWAGARAAPRQLLEGSPFSRAPRYAAGAALEESLSGAAVTRTPCVSRLEPGAAPPPPRSPRPPFSVCHSYTPFADSDACPGGATESVAAASGALSATRSHASPFAAAPGGAMDNAGDGGSSGPRGAGVGRMPAAAAAALAARRGGVAGGADDDEDDADEQLAFLKL